MTDAEFDPQKKRIQVLADKWLAPLGLLWWRIDIEYSRGPLIIDGKPSEETIGKASVKWEYQAATLSFNLAKFVSFTDEEAEAVFVHECCHVLVHQMREWCQTETLPADTMDRVMKHEEYVVSSMAKAFIWTYKAGAGKLIPTSPSAALPQPKSSAE